VLTSLSEWAKSRHSEYTARENPTALMRFGDCDREDMISELSPPAVPPDRALMGSPATLSKMLADCEVLYFPALLVRAKIGKLLTSKEASDARDKQMELPI
jgi:hypothetical protein